MKIINFGDTHIHHSHEYSYPTANGSTKRLDEHIATYRYLCSVIEEEKPDIVINNGDIIHSQGNIATEVIATASICEKKIAAVCKSIGSQYWVLVGNHDKKSDRPDGAISTRFLEGYYDLQLITFPEVRDQIFLIPHLSRHQYHLLHEIKHTGYLLTFSHLDICGAKYHSQMYDTSGATEESGISGIVFNGHYHEKQEIRLSNETTVVCTGAPQYWSRREPRFGGRGYLVITTDIHSNTTKWEHKSIPAPDFITLSSPTVKEIESINPKHYLHIKLMYETQLEKLREALSGRIYSSEIVVDRPNKAVCERELLPQFTKEECISNYVKMSLSGLKEDMLMEIGLEMLK